MIDEKYEIKVIDLGLAAVFAAEEDELGYFVNMAGTLAYCAPEILLVGEEGEDRAYHGPAQDIWSLGAIFFELAAKKMPFGKKGPAKNQVPVYSDDMDEGLFHELSSRFLIS